MTITSTVAIATNLERAEREANHMGLALTIGERRGHHTMVSLTGPRTNVQHLLLRWGFKPKDFPQYFQGPVPAILRIHATCPHCGFDGTVQPQADAGYDNGHDKGRGGFPSQCESCGEHFIIEADEVHEVQHAALRLLGEA